MLGCAAGPADPDEEEAGQEVMDEDENVDESEGQPEASQVDDNIDNGESGELDEEALLAAAEADETAAESQWQSRAYAAHFDVEWSKSDLEARSSNLVRSEAQLPGIGAAASHLPPEEDLVQLPVRSAACLASAGVLPPLRKAWVKASGAKARVAPEASSLLAALSSYKDVLLSAVPYGHYAEKGLMRVLALHALQHAIVGARQRMRHDKKNIDARDQGFTRPTVLVILPLRNHALHFVEELLELMPAQYEQVENKARFISEFSAPEDEPPVPAARPDDYKTLFEGNIDDCFRCGLRFSRKAVKLYAAFYKADIVIASPIGLRLNLGAEGDKIRDTDWLSSLEVVIAPYADVFLMQNWEHLHEIFALLNCQPKQQRDTDFNRVRSYHLDGIARSVRQTVLLASQPAPELKALFERQCANAFGRVESLPTYEGAIATVPAGGRQLLVRFDVADPLGAADARMAAFRERLLPSITRSLSAGTEGQTILFVPSYLDYVRVRNLLRQEDVPFGELCEYTPPKQASRNRTMLHQGRLGLLLLTERAHFFHRHRLSGARHLAFFAPPLHTHFYVELMQMMHAPASVTCVCLFSRLDILPLSRLVGSARAGTMVTGSETSYLFQ